MKKATSLEELRTQYPCIVEWGRQLRSFEYYINDQLIEAESLNAPRNTIYFRNGEPVTTDTMGNIELKKQLEELL